MHKQNKVESETHNHMNQFVTFILFRWSGRPAQRKPAAVHDNNQHIRGVDRMDQMVAYYSFGRKSIKWWRKVFFWMVEVMVNNAHILYTRHTSSQRKLQSAQKEGLQGLQPAWCWWREAPHKHNLWHLFRPSSFVH